MALVAVSVTSMIFRPKVQGHLPVCRSNLKDIATALDFYAADNAGKYPESLDRLANGYFLMAIPTCPAAGKVTYLDYQVSTEMDFFSVSCCGDNHREAYSGYWPKSFRPDSRGYPKYNSRDGLISHP